MARWNRGLPSQGKILSREQHGWLGTETEAGRTGGGGDLRGNVLLEVCRVDRAAL